jgi:hypothetical protein
MNPVDIQMDVASLLEDCRRRGIQLHVKNGELSYCAAKGAMTEEIASVVRTRKSDILHHLKHLEKSRFHVAAASANRAPLFNRFLWKDYPNRIMEISSANAPHIVMRCTGELLTDSLLRSIDLLLERHDVLNSCIEIAGENLHLVCRAKESAAFREVIVSVGTALEREDEAYRIANDLVWEEYDLDKGPLYRVFLIRLSAIEYILGVALHHAIGDLISIGILFQDLFSIYCSVAAGTPLRLSPTRFRYIDYLASMESWSISPACEDHIRYWKDKLKSTPVTCLPLNRNHTLNGLVSESTAETKFQLDAGTARDLKELAVQLKTTLFTVLLTIYKIAFWRMTGQVEPVVVALHAGRCDAGFQNTIGNFALEVAYKTSLSGNPCFKEAAGRVTHTINEANSHQPVPLDWIRRVLGQDGISFSAPGINFMSVGEAGHMQNPLNSRPLSFTPPGARHGCHGFPVSFAIEFRDSGGAILGSMVYRKDLYDESAIGKFMDCFIRTASGAVRFPERKLCFFI